MDKGDARTRPGRADSENPLLNPYRRSKILAERAAWDFMASAGGKTAAAHQSRPFDRRGP
jgi:nucleoside-diphosphate-sugar epimerase